MFFPKLPFVNKSPESGGWLAGPTRRYAFDGKLEGHHHSGVYLLSATTTGRLLASAGKLIDYDSMTYYLHLWQEKMDSEFMTWKTVLSSVHHHRCLLLLSKSVRFGGLLVQMTRGKFYALEI